MEQNNAGILIRIFAYIIDKLILLSVSLTPVFILSKEILNNSTNEDLITTFLLGFLMMFIFTVKLIKILYSTLLISKMGSTLGQLLAGIEVVDYNSGQHIDLKTSFLRSTVGMIFSNIFLFLGHFAIIKNEENLAWHDDLFNTKVIKKGTFIPGIVIAIILLAVSIYLLVSIGLNITSMF